jgi:hypothetical protein
MPRIHDDLDEAKPGLDPLLDGLSEWDCDPIICGITGPCDACKRRERVAAILRQRDLERRPCTLNCTLPHPCDHCKEVADYLAWLYQQRDSVVILLRCLRQLAKVFPDEFRELLAPAVVDIMQEVKR